MLSHIDSDHIIVVVCIAIAIVAGTFFVRGIQGWD